MKETIRMKGDSNLDFSSDAESFYKNYWKEGECISDESQQRFEKIIEIVFPKRPTGKKILEIGVGGEGGLLRYLKNDNEVMGVDASQSAMNSSAQFGIKVDIVNIDRQSLPFEDKIFDFIFIIDIIEHLANPQFVIEEMKRVLKDEGQFFLTSPNPMIHHWPRLFYPSLFEQQNFREFLIVNELHILNKSNLFYNRYTDIVDDEDMKTWVWGWLCKKISNDSDKHFLNGIYFWEQRNNYGVRVKTIEALEMFKKSILNDDAKLSNRLFFVLASIYRFMSGETDDFTRNYNFILNLCVNGNYPDNMKATFMILLIYFEFLFNGHELFGNNKFMELTKYLSEFPDSGPYNEIIRAIIINKSIPNAAIIINTVDAEDLIL